MITTLVFFAVAVLLFAWMLCGDWQPWQVGVVLLMWVAFLYNIMGAAN